MPTMCEEESLDGLLLDHILERHKQMKLTKNDVMEKLKLADLNFLLCFSQSLLVWVVILSVYTCIMPWWVIFHYNPLTHAHRMVNGSTFVGLADEKARAEREFERRQQAGENVGLVESR